MGVYGLNSDRERSFFFFLCVCVGRISGFVFSLGCALVHERSLQLYLVF